MLHHIQLIVVVDDALCAIVVGSDSVRESERERELNVNYHSI